MKMKAFEIVGEALSAEGVDTVFAMMTSDNMALMIHLQSSGVKIVSTRTEHGAVCMADGYARATGRIGVASIGAGPSAGMAGTALVTARKRRSPIVVIAGDVPTSDRHHLKGFAQEEFFKTTAGHCITVTSLRKIVQDSYQVLRHARSGAGPAVLNFPVNLLEAEIDMEELGSDWRFMSPWSPPPPPAPDARMVEEAAKLLATAERPVLLAGRGAIAARDAITACADRVGALLGTTVQAQNLFDSDWHVGIVGTLGFGLAMPLVDQADVVVAIGAGLNTYTSGFGQLFPKAELIQIDNRPEAFGAMMPVDIPVLGDAEAAMRAIDQALGRMDIAPRPGFRDDTTRKQIAAAKASLNVEYTAKNDVIDPRQVLDVLQARLPKNHLDVTDAGHFLFFVADRIRAQHPEDRLWTADFASIGIATSAGIGAAVARPDRHTVVFIGDGGFMMSLIELDTAVRNRVPMTVVVLNDEAYGAEVRYLENRGDPVELVCFASPDIAGMVRAMGCQAATVHSLAELEAACDTIGKPDVPFVIDARVDPTVVHRLYAGLKGSAASSH